MKGSVILLAIKVALLGAVWFSFLFVLSDEHLVSSGYYLLFVSYCVSLWMRLSLTAWYLVSLV